MNNLNPAIGDATRTEKIGAKLDASELFGASLGTAQGNSAYGAAEQPADAAQSAEPAAAEQLPGDTALTAQEAAQRHVVAGVGNVPNVQPPRKTPYDHLADLLGHSSR